MKKTDIQQVLNYKITPKITLLQGLIFGAVGIIGLNLLIKGVKGAFANPLVENIEQSLDNNQLTYPESQYFIFADQIESVLQTSMSKGWEVYPVFEQMQNQHDVGKLIVAFGERRNYWFGVPTYNEGLAYWLKDELKDSELSEVNRILSEKNINMQF